ncbi:MAG: uroporphyrinogen-III synthase [Flavobacteriaceae bacterium]
MKKVLSTKKLTPPQKQAFLNAGIEVEDYDAISVTFLDFEAPKKIENAIFTSQNAVHCLKGKHIEIQNCFCVGQKTKRALEILDKNVVKTTKNSKELAQFIQNSFKNASFYYFSGSRRRDEIPVSFNTSENTLFEIKTYQIELNLKHFTEKWVGILFFSPSGVESFFEANPHAFAQYNPLAICIGKTTASEVQKYTQHYYTANDTSIESVIQKTIETFLIHD